MVTADPSAHHPVMAARLLIVDDSPLICTGLARLLQAIQGVDAIQTACTLAETLECLRRQLPTLLVLDPSLLDCNAIELIRWTNHDNRRKPSMNTPSPTASGMAATTLRLARADMGLVAEATH